MSPAARAGLAPLRRQLPPCSSENERALRKVRLSGIATLSKGCQVRRLRAILLARDGGAHAHVKSMIERLGLQLPDDNCRVAGKLHCPLFSSRQTRLTIAPRNLRDTNASCQPPR